MADIESFNYFDELVEEYLLFRGFVSSLNSFRQDKKNDKTKGYQVKSIVAQLFTYVQQHNLVELKRLWDHLCKAFFQRLDDDYYITIRKLDLSLKRYFIVHCIQSGKMEKVTEFFQLYASEISSDEIWNPWLAIPYIKHPENDNHFKIFFTKSWLDTFHRSLENFLATIFQSIPLPKALNFHVERTIRRTMQEKIDTLLQENESLKNRNTRLREELKASQKKENDALSALGTIQGTRSSNNETRSHEKQTSWSSDTHGEDEKDFTVRIHAPITKFEDSIFMEQEELSHEEEEEDFLHESTPDDSISIRQLSVEKFSESSPLNRCCFSPDGQLVACGTSSGVIRIWPVDASQKRSATIYGSTEVTALEWEQKTGNLLLCGSADGRIRIWNVNEDNIVDNILLYPYPSVKDIACSPVGDVFATSSGSTSKDLKSAALFIYNIKTLQMSRKVEVGTVVNAICFNHNGTMMVVGGHDGHIRIYDVSSMTSIVSWKAHNGPVMNVKYSHDETEVYSIGLDEKVLRWSVHNPGKIIKTYVYYGNHESVGKIDLAFDSIQNYFIVPSKLPQGQIYHESQSTPILSVGTHHSPVLSCDWHPHESKVITGSLDGTLCLSSLAYM